MTGILVTGTNLTGATAVSFGAGITINSFIVDNATQITVNITVSAAAALGLRNVAVTTPLGTGTKNNAFAISDVFVSASIGGATIANVTQGGEFIVRLTITQVTNFTGFDIRVSYDKTVTEVITPFPGNVAGTLWVTPGQIESTIIPLDAAAFIPPGVQGSSRIFGHLSQLTGASSANGAGYLADIHFRVLGTAGQNSNITLSNIYLYDKLANSIPAVLVNGSVQVIEAPIITGISTTKPNGSYTTGETMDIGVTYSENVNVNTAGGIPSLGLNSGGNALYQSGSGTNTLTFHYIVAAGQNSADLDYPNTNSLVLNGATIQDAALNNADNTLPMTGTFSGTHAIIIDTTSPAIASVSTTHANGAFTIGENIDIQVTYSENVIVNTAGGTPSLGLNSGGSALYQSGSGTNILNFRYTVGASQNSADLDYPATNSLALNGGTIRDTASNNANNILPGAGTFAAAHDIVIDTLAPSVTLNSAATNPTNVSTIPVTATFSENVNGFAIGDIIVSNGAAGNFGGGPSTYTFDVTPGVQGIVSLNINAGAAQDAAGNQTSAATQLSRTFDTTVPTVTAVNTLNANGVYGFGGIIDITISYSENVNVNTAGGTPSLALNSGGSAVYHNGSGTNILTFRYLVGLGQSSPDLVYSTVNSLALSGGTIRDAASNNANNTLPPTEGFTAAHDIIINTTLPTVTTVDPNLGAQINTLDVTITGTNFTGTSVDFGTGITVNHFNVNSTTSITANITIDAHAPTGTRNVLVSTTSGSGTLTNGFTVLLRGDANGDGSVGIADVIKAELIMLGAQPTPGADANGDGDVGIADIITIELIMAGVIT